MTADIVPLRRLIACRCSRCIALGVTQAELDRHFDFFVAGKAEAADPPRSIEEYDRGPVNGGVDLES